MTRHWPDNPITERDRADVAALADGSLSAQRRAEVEARVAAVPALQRLLESQRSAVRAVRRAAVPAPPGVRARIEAQRGQGGLLGQPRRRPAVAAALAAAATGLVLALVLPGGGAQGPDVADAATLAARAPEGPPPPRYDGEPALLARSVGGVRFPRWEDRFGWRAVGVRTDRLDGRRAVTVYYARGGRRVGYTIVSGRALPAPSRARRTEREGTQLRALRVAGRPVVTWRRNGRTCVLSGSGVPHQVLLRLASWRGEGKLGY